MKKTNKGFSLVELIIVIAIMAILAGAIAPALIRYIDKSRRSNDVTSCKSIKTAIETALGNEDVYAYLTNNGGTETDFTQVIINPGKSTSGETGEGGGGTTNPTPTTAIAISGCDKPAEGETTVAPDKIDEYARTEIGTNIGEKTPKVKYKKAGTKSSTDKPECFVALISGKGTVFVCICSNGNKATSVTNENNVLKPDKGYLICPEICEDYQ